MVQESNKRSFEGVRCGRNTNNNEHQVCDLRHRMKPSKKLSKRSPPHAIVITKEWRFFLTLFRKTASDLA
uniref:Uncharacterized protein n=1 Tax=Romanomermis culicivorax TaxID=13658 RepID=A0A915KBC6_ROMCU